MTVTSAPPRQGAARPDSLSSRFGPGLVTGAADDDPSGIATYSQVGAQFGFALGWTLPFSLPLMWATQEACARIGFATGTGIAGNLRRHAPRSVLHAALALLLVANICNLGADLAAMADAARLLLGGPALAWMLGFAVVCTLVPIRLSWRRYSAVLKFLTLSLLAYVAVLFTLRVPWGQALAGALVPSLPGGSTALMALVAVLGTTISPYLFFWQAAQEVEERRASGPKRMPASRLLAGLKRIRLDTVLGMAASNLIALCIVIAAAATLHPAGHTEIRTAAEAAEALRPLAGPLAELIFAAGIIGTGLLAIPALSGSAAYALAEGWAWKAGFDQPLDRAGRFYAAMAAITAAGLALTFTGIDPVRALYWSAVLNGLLAPPLMVAIMLLATRASLMRGAVLPRWLAWAGWTATLAMAAAAGALVVSWIVGP